MTAAPGRSVTRAVMSAVIVRACAACGHPRQAGQPCAGCGLAEAPVVCDLGVQAAWYRSPLRQAWWRAAGSRRAAARARKASAA